MAEREIDEQYRVSANNQNQDNIYNFLIRHGQPEVYGEDNSPLTYEGVMQVVDGPAAYICKRLSVNPERKKIVVVIHSPRLRAAQTSRAILGEVSDYVMTNGLDVEILQSTENQELLSTDNTLTKFIDDVPLSKKYAPHTWLTLSDEDAEAYGVRSSNQVATDVEKLMNGTITPPDDGQEEGVDRINICSAHETHLMAILYRRYPHNIYSIDYADFIEIRNEDRNRGTWLHYKNKGVIVPWGEKMNEAEKKGTEDVSMSGWLEQGQLTRLCS